jgi:hypothetical protein
MRVFNVIISMGVFNVIGSNHVTKEIFQQQDLSVAHARVVAV